MSAAACEHVAEFVDFYNDTPVTLLYMREDGSRDFLACVRCDVTLTLDQFHDLLIANGSDASLTAADAPERDVPAHTGGVIVLKKPTGCTTLTGTRSHWRRRGWSLISSLSWVKRFLAEIEAKYGPLEHLEDASCWCGGCALVGFS